MPFHPDHYGFVDASITRTQIQCKLLTGQRLDHRVRHVVAICIQRRSIKAQLRYLAKAFGQGPLYVVLEGILHQFRAH
ncbi:hypothetical protein D3C71_1972350 [compost metagenome]